MNDARSRVYCTAQSASRPAVLVTEEPEWGGKPQKPRDIWALLLRPYSSTKHLHTWLWPQERKGGGAFRVSPKKSRFLSLREEKGGGWKCFLEKTVPKLNAVG